MRVKTIRQISLAFLLSVISFTLTAHNNVVVIPLGGEDVVPEVETAKTVFLTTEQYAGTDFTGSEGADEICMTEAQEFDVEGEYKALIANGQTGRDIIPVRPNFALSAGLPIINVKGERLHRIGLALLHTSPILFENILTYADGTEPNVLTSEIHVWSGLASGGLLGGGLDTRCNDWGTHPLPIENTGSSNQFSSTLFNNSPISFFTPGREFDCSAALHLLCVEQ